LSTEIILENEAEVRAEITSMIEVQDQGPTLAEAERKWEPENAAKKERIQQC